jgi:hypothetical protein
MCFRNFSGEPKNNFSQKPFWWSHKYFAYMSIIIKQTHCRNLRVEIAIVLVLFKLLNSPLCIFMSLVLSSFILSWVCYNIFLNGIKKFKKLIYTNNCMGNCKISKIGDIWIISDFRLICGYFFVTGNHNKTENEILSFRKQKKRTIRIS